VNTSERHVYRISAQKVTRLLLLTVLCLTLASLGSQFLIYIWGSNGLLAPLQTFNTGHDTNIPTWYSSFALFLSSILLAIIATAKKRNKDRYTLHWFFLFGIFLLLSIDEVAMIHESTQV
jgi:hypothetical protein